MGPARIRYCATAAVLLVYLRNTGPDAVVVDDILLQDISMKQAMGCKPSKTYRDGLAYACSIHIPAATNPITTAQRQTLIDAGEPIWYRIHPQTIAPQETAEVYVRMRVRVATTLSLTVKPLVGDNIPLSTTVSSNDVPRVSGYAMSPSMDKLYLYFRHPQKGKSPVQILLDGQNITAASTMGSDANLDVIPVVCNLASPLVRGSFHCFQAVYDDSTKATAGARVFSDDMQYGLWGGPNAPTTEEQRAHVLSMGRHNVNIQVLGAVDANNYMKSTEGLALMDQLGIWRIHSDPAKAFGRLYGLFLCDEPDAGDAAVASTVVPTYAQLGTLAESLWYRSQSFWPTYSTAPNVVNLDSTFKPHNWYVYGQLPDIFSADPYYQVRLADAYWSRPYQVPIYTKATYIYGVTSVCMAACEPKPFHIILNCTRKQDGTRIFRFATPEEKRIEVYYALAGGAKQYAYWWFTPTTPTTSSSNGMGADEPDAAALWREIGLLGAEVRTAGPVIVKSWPAQVVLTAPGELWTRTLVSGLDTIVLVCVNDDYANDRAGTTIRPIASAEVSVDLPSWLDPTQVFEIDYKGIHDVSYTKTGSKLDLHLGKVNVTRLIIATSDAALRSTLTSLYNTKFAANVSQLIPIRQARTESTNEKDTYHMRNHPMRPAGGGSRVGEYYLCQTPYEPAVQRSDVGERVRHGPGCRECRGPQR